MVKPGRRGFGAYESDLIDLISEQKVLYYKDLALAFNISPSTASNFASMLASKYPNNVKYQNGILFLMASFTENQLPPEKRIRVLGETLAARDRQIMELEEKRKKAKEIIKKIENNHLRHGELEKLKEELKKLEEVLSEGA
jgi:DeoR/GlpR family transcriptional regulator of sugar metabolism